MDATDDREEVTSERMVEETETPPARHMAAAVAPFKRLGIEAQEVKKKMKVEAEPEPTNSKKLYMTLDEERSLLHILRELALEGWKAGQGWKRGTYPKAAAKLRSSDEGSTVTGKNVEHKIQTWSKLYRLVNEFSKLSGVSIDHETHAVIVDSDEMWDEYVKVDSKYSKLRGKTFPYYDLWGELFGLYRATGAGARDHGAVEKETTPTPNMYYELIDDYEEGIDDSVEPKKPTSFTKEQDAAGVDGAASCSRGKSKKTLPTSQSSLTCKAGKTLANLDVCFMCAERLFTEQEQTLKDDSKMQKTAKLKKDLQDHTELTLVERLRLIDHFLAYEGHYYYWTTMDVEERAKFIKVFNEGKLG